MSEEEVERVIDAAREVFQSEDMLLTLSAPLTFVGDIHGQFPDLLYQFETNGFPSEDNRFLFLGDYVDRGRMGTETIVLLLCYKILHPHSLFLLRGNHESGPITRIYGFYDEVTRRFSEPLWKKFTELFNWMPVSAIVAGRILAMHGGLSPDLKDLAQIKALKRPQEVPSKGLLCDLLWSDPNKIITSGWAENSRGISFSFAADIVKDFCKAHKLNLIVRAHQVVENGYEFFASRHLLTIFSAPNYCGEMENSAATMTVNEDLTCSFRIFRPKPGKWRPL